MKSNRQNRQVETPCDSQNKDVPQQWSLNESRGIASTTSNNNIQPNRVRSLTNKDDAINKKEL